MIFIAGSLVLVWLLMKRSMTKNAELENMKMKKPSRTNPRWRFFEIFVLSFTGILIVTSSLIVFDFGFVTDFIRAQTSFIQFNWWAVEVDVLILILYSAIKIPVVAGDLSGSFSRLYVGRWRVHESVFGLLGILTGTLYVFYGNDLIDHAIGVFYLIFGAFLMGRDYQDVKALKFVHKEGFKERVESS